MSDTKILNKLAEKENSFNDEAEGSTALYYGELENVLTDEQFKKLAKLSKYNKYFKNKDLEDVKKILKDTNKKRGICRSLLNKNNNEIYFNVPYSKYSDSEDDDDEFSYYPIFNSKNNSVFENINASDVESLKSECRLFYSVYCENLKEHLKRSMGDSYTDEYIATYNSECNCYADRLKDKKELNPNDDFYKQFTDSYLNSIQPHCELTECHNDSFNYAPMTVAETAACNNMTICTNTVNFADFDIDKSTLDIIGNLSNNCGNDSELAKSLKNKDKKKQETTPEKQTEPKTPETPTKPDTPSGSSESDIPSKPEIPDVPSGDVPSGNVPSGNVPSGNVPSGDVPSGNVPSGDVPSGNVPSGDVPSGNVPIGDVPSGSSGSDIPPTPEKETKKKINSSIYLIIGFVSVIIVLVLLLILVLVL